jgi:hypothetical protein
MVTKLRASGGNLVFSMFLGGGESESGSDLSIWPDGSITAAGNTRSGNFPTTANAYDRFLGGSGDAFVARFDPTGRIL